MYDELNDLRILKIALAVDDIFQSYKESLLHVIEDGAVQRELEESIGSGEAHERLEQVHDRLHAAVQDQSDTLQQEDVLQVMLECERSARNLFLRYLDRVKDPQIVELLRALALEEEDHARIIERALRRAGLRPAQA